MRAMTAVFAALSTTEQAELDKGSDAFMRGFGWPFLLMMLGLFVAYVIGLILWHRFITPLGRRWRR